MTLLYVSMLALTEGKEHKSDRISLMFNVPELDLINAADVDFQHITLVKSCKTIGNLRSTGSPLDTSVPCHLPNLLVPTRNNDVGDICSWPRLRPWIFFQQLGHQ